MKIEKNKYVTIHYTLTDDDGAEIDSSRGTEPLAYVHGNNYLLAKLESELEGKEPGAKFSTVIEAADGYGEVNPQLIVDVPRDQFETDQPLEEGMKFQAMTAYGPTVVTIKKVNDSTVTVDGNHELAGVRLHFDVEVVDVRNATEDELNPPSCGCGGGCGGCGGDCNCEGSCDDGSCGCGGCGN